MLAASNLPKEASPCLAGSVLFHSHTKSATRPPAAKKPVLVVSLPAPSQPATRTPMPLLDKMIRLLDKMEVAGEVESWAAESRAAPTLGVLLVVGESRRW